MFLTYYVIYLVFCFLFLVLYLLALITMLVLAFIYFQQLKNQLLRSFDHICKEKRVINYYYYYY